MNVFVLTAWLRARHSTSERGANLVEYILLLAFIAIILIVAVRAFGNTVSSRYSSTNSGVQTIG